MLLKKDRQFRRLLVQIITGVQIVGTLLLLFILWDKQTNINNILILIYNESTLFLTIVYMGPSLNWTLVFIVNVVIRVRDF